MKLHKRLSDDGKTRQFFRQPDDEEPIGIIQRRKEGWVIDGHEDKRVFADPEVAERYIDIVSAFEYIPRLIRPSIPRLYAEQDMDDLVAHVKLFTPWAGWTWYICQASHITHSSEKPVHEAVWTQGVLEPGLSDVICFGYVVGPHPEFGDFSLGELAAIRGPAGLRIERDLHFKPTRVSDALT